MADTKMTQAMILWNSMLLSYGNVLFNRPERSLPIGEFQRVIIRMHYYYIFTYPDCRLLC
jgi:hypothetical protein